MTERTGMGTRAAGRTSAAVPASVGRSSGLVTFRIALTLALRPGPSKATGVVDGPVVAVSRPGAAYPMALVQGNLNLRGDCMMLGNAVVFWPAGTSWDDENQSVVFSGDFDGAAPVGSPLRGEWRGLHPGRRLPAWSGCGRRRAA